MGIRERLGRVMRAWLTVAAGGWGAVVGRPFAEKPSAVLMIGSFVATCAAMAAMLAFVRCPACRARLSQIGFAAALAPAAASRYERCPACGTRLD